MKSLTNLMLAAAALAVVSTAASAQVLQAEIPFNFRTENIVMPAGTYEVTGHNAGRWYQFYNRATHESVTLFTRAYQDAPKAWQRAGQPVLEFACDAGRCAPTRLWAGQRNEASGFYHHGKEGKSGQLAMIRLILAKGR